MSTATFSAFEAGFKLYVPGASMIGILFSPTLIFPFANSRPPSRVQYLVTRVWSRDGNRRRFFTAIEQHLKASGSHPSY